MYRKFVTLLSIFVFIAQSTAFDHDCGRRKLPKEEIGSSSRAKRFIIPGGTPTIEDSWPWIVALGLPGDCGGTIIGDRWVLTAGHCIDERFTKDSILPKTVYASAHKLNSSDGTVPLAVKNYTLHDDYRYLDFRGFCLWDFAIIELAERIDFGKHPELGKVCLPSNDSDVVFNKERRAVTLGWGAQNTPTPIRELLEVNMSYTGRTSGSPATCPDPDNVEAEFCAVGKPNKFSGVCKGDSGGPLMTAHGDVYFEYGVNAWVTGLTYKWENDRPYAWCFTEQYAHFSRVTAACSWINKTTEGEVQCVEPPSDV